MKDDLTVDQRVEPYTWQEWRTICRAYHEAPSIRKAYRVVHPDEPPPGVLAAAGQYLESCELKDATKPNARKDIERLSEWVSEGRRLEVCKEAQEHLASKRETTRVAPPTSVNSLLQYLFAFEREHRKALKNLPPAPRSGPKEAIAEERLIYELRRSYPDRNGWQKFFRLCTDPLVERHGLPYIADFKGWGEKLTEAKKRFEEYPRNWVENS